MCDGKRRKYFKTKASLEKKFWDRGERSEIKMELAVNISVINSEIPSFCLLIELS